MQGENKQVKSRVFFIFYIAQMPYVFTGMALVTNHEGGYEAGCFQIDGILGQNPLFEFSWRVSYPEFG